MTYQECIDGLRFTMKMMTWREGVDEAYNCNPSELNEDDKTTYDACKFAIQALEGIVATKEIYEELQPFPDTLEFFYSGYHRAIRNIEENIEELSE